MKLFIITYSKARAYKIQGDVLTYDIDKADIVVAKSERDALNSIPYAEDSGGVAVEIKTTVKKVIVLNAKCNGNHL